MALSLTASKFNCFIGENYQVSLNQSLEKVLAEIQQKTPNLSNFVDVFYELMQAEIDPTFESIWVYSALVFRSQDFANEDALNRLSATKDLFQLISACSSPCSSSKSIALLAPVVFQVCNLVAEILGKDLSSKKEKKAIREVKSFIEVILGHISICCSKDLDEESRSTDMKFAMSVQDLVSVWKDGNESFQSFFPLVCNEMCREITGRGVSYLAGVVVVEAFLLKLCFSLRFEAAEVKVEELRSWTVGAITGFRSFYFFEILVGMLLQPSLPVTSLLNSEEAVLLTDILYDAVILVEYSFLDSQRVNNLPAETVENLTMGRLILTQKAIKHFREKADRKKAIRYSNAFSNSKLPTQLTKRITSQIGVHEKAGISETSSPMALIKWLLDLEKQGIKVFEDGKLKCHAKIVLDDSEADNGKPASKSGMKVDDDLLFYVDNKREAANEEQEDDEDEGGEDLSSAFLAAAHSMKSAEKGGRKRKSSEGKERKGNKRNSKDDDISSDDKDDFSSDSEVENPSSDEDA